jgi:hypothetical protein
MSRASRVAADSDMSSDSSLTELASNSPSPPAKRRKYKTSQSPEIESPVANWIARISHHEDATVFQDGFVAQSLPYEIWEQIICLLDASDQAALAMTCKVAESLMPSDASQSLELRARAWNVSSCSSDSAPAFRTTIYATTASSKPMYILSLATSTELTTQIPPNDYRLSRL